MGLTYGQRSAGERALWRGCIAAGECWLWCGETDAGGYGLIVVDEYLVTTHRLAWQLTRGPIPRGLFVLHACDVPACVRPDHLWLGTARDNARDRDAKARDRPRGGVAGRSVAQRLEIVRAARAVGARVADVAAAFAVSRCYVAMLRNGFIPVDGAVAIPIEATIRVGRPPTPRDEAARAAAIAAVRARGISTRALGRALGISSAAVRLFLQGTGPTGRILEQLRERLGIGTPAPYAGCWHPSLAPTTDVPVAWPPSGAWAEQPAFPAMGDSPRSGFGFEA